LNILSSPAGRRSSDGQGGAVGRSTSAFLMASINSRPQELRQGLGPGDAVDRVGDLDFLQGVRGLEDVDEPAHRRPDPVVAQVQLKIGGKALSSGSYSHTQEPIRTPFSSRNVNVARKTAFPSEPRAEEQFAVVQSMVPLSFK